jgi:hypothetical protein
MEVAQTSQITRITDIVWNKDGGRLLRLIDKYFKQYSGRVEIKLYLSNGLLQVFNNTAVHNNISNITFGLPELTYNNEPIQAEIIVLGIDNTINHNNAADRLFLLEPANPENIYEKYHPLQYNPMFFRPSGSSIDLVDLFRNAFIFLICNGPSFNEVDKTKLQLPGIQSFGINNGAHYFKPHLWACTDSPNNFMDSIWLNSTIMKFIPLAYMDKPIWDSENNRESLYNVSDCPNVIGFRRNINFNYRTWLNEPSINWGSHEFSGNGQSTMLAALKICYLLGFKNVYLVGCDFKMNQQQAYWFHDETTFEHIDHNNRLFAHLQQYFDLLQPVFQEEKFHVYNTNKDNELKSFPFIDYETAIETALKEPHKHS